MNQEVNNVNDIIGQNPAILAVKEQIRRVAQTDLKVFLGGETGTGKGLVAKAIHATSARSTSKFVAIQLGSISKDLVESEIFGHDAGAFTGATREKPGRIEKAEGGTVFLDEVENLELGVQAKLLEFLEEGVFTRVGGVRERQLNARIISAANVDLRQMVDEGKFRKDLYYRLAVYPIKLPLLRDRLSDIPLLTEHFLQRTSKQLTDEAMESLLSYGWPGNVRELENAIARACVEATSNLIGAKEFLYLQESKEVGVQEGSLEFRNADGRVLTRREVERMYFEYLLKVTKGNKLAAARLGGIARQTLSRQIQSFGLVPSGPGLKPALEETERSLILALLRKHNWNVKRTAEREGIPHSTLKNKMKRLGISSSHDEDGSE